MSAPIFISYSSKDQEIAETIYQALESRGLDCWIACRDVPPGENFQEAIVRALRSAQVMLLVFTSNANNSDEIKKELVLAGRHRVTVVPIRVEDVVPNDAFTYEFATRQWIDLFKDWEREIELLASKLDHVLANAKPRDGGGAETPAAVRPSMRAAKRSSNLPLVLGAALAAVLIIAGGAVLYMRTSARTAPPAPMPAAQTAAQTPPPAQALPPPVASSPPAPTVAPPEPPAAAPALSPDEAAWQTAETASTIAAFRDYQKNFPAGLHAQAAELRVLDLTLMVPATAAKAFDGTWMTIWTCPAAGSALGFSFQFNTQVKDGTIRGVHGTPGERSSLVLDGKLQSDGNGAIIGKGVVGSSVFAVGGQAAGTPYAFHAVVHFDRTTGTGHRIEGRPCDMTFVKQ